MNFLAKALGGVQPFYNICSCTRPKTICYKSPPYRCNDLQFGQSVTIHVDCQTGEECGRTPNFQCCD